MFFKTTAFTHRFLADRGVGLELIGSSQNLMNKTASLSLGRAIALTTWRRHAICRRRYNGIALFTDAFFRRSGARLSFKGCRLSVYAPLSAKNQFINFGPLTYILPASPPPWRSLSNRKISAVGPCRGMPLPPAYVPQFFSASPAASR